MIRREGSIGYHSSREAAPAVRHAGAVMPARKDSAGRLRRTASPVALAALGAMVSLPFLSPDAFEPIGSFLGEWWAVVFGLVAVTALAVGRLPAASAAPRVVLLPVGIAALVALHAAVGFAAHERLALLACLYLLWAAATMWAARVLADTVGPDRLATVLAWCLLGGALASALAAVVQSWGWLAWFGGMIVPSFGGRAYGNLGQANHFADYLALGLVAIVYLRVTARLPGVWLLPLAVVFAYALTLSASRSSWLYLTVLFAGALVTSLSLPTPVRRRLVVAAALPVAGFVVFQVLASLGSVTADPAAVTTAHRLPVPGAGGEERWTIWVGAVRMFLEAPWTGAGFGRFAERFFEILPGLPAPRPTVVTTNAHNLLLQVAAELGVPGLVILGAGIVAWALGARRGAMRPERAFFLGLLVVIGIHSLLEYPLWYAYFLGIAAIALGASDEARLEFGRARLVPLGAAAALVLGWFACVTVMSDYHVLRDFQVFRRRAMLAEGTDAVTRRLLEVQRRSMLSFLVELGFARAIEADRERLADKLALNTQVMRVFPEPDVAYRQALLLALAGEAGQAQAQWNRASRLYPSDAHAWIERAREGRQPELDALVQFVESKGEKS